VKGGGRGGRRRERKRKRRVGKREGWGDREKEREPEGLVVLLFVKRFLPVTGDYPSPPPLCLQEKIVVATNLCDHLELEDAKI
jgi:hypothetical protein